MHSLLNRPPLARSLAFPAGLALAAVCIVHLLDGPGSLQDNGTIGVLELALAVACAPLAVLLVMRPTRPLWSVALALNLVAATAYVLSRTVGLLGSDDDIGNWGPLLGVLNLVAEGALIVLAVRALQARRS